MVVGDVCSSVATGVLRRTRRPAGRRPAGRRPRHRLRRWFHRRRAGGGGPDPRSDRGQSTVEVALLLPVVVLLALAIVQVSVVAHQRLVVTHAAREAARSAAVTPGAHVDGASLGDRHRLDPARLTVRSSGPDAAGFVLVEVRYVVATDVPLVGAVLPDVTVGAAASMVAEW